MALGGRMNPYQTVDGPTFIMRVLLNLVPLLLVAWSINSTEALPVHSKLPNSNEVLTKEQRNMTMILPKLAKMNLTSKDLEYMEPEDRNKVIAIALGLTPAPEKSQCKNFFWKTFSAC